MQHLKSIIFLNKIIIKIICNKTKKKTNYKRNFYYKTKKIILYIVLFLTKN